MGEVCFFLGLGANTMAIAGARAYNGGLKAEPQRGPGAEPLVGAPEAESLFKL